MSSPHDAERPSISMGRELLIRLRSLLRLRNVQFRTGGVLDTDGWD